MHILGLNGMPRRVYTYATATGWGPLNLVASVGASVIALSVVVFVVNVARSWIAGRPAGDDPWNASGLEWATASPPPSYSFIHPPQVTGRHPLWETDVLPVVTGLSVRERQVLVTTTFDALPDYRHSIPKASIWPLYLALCMGVLWIGSIFSPYFVLAGVAISLVGLAGWGWVGSSQRDEERVAFADGTVKLL